MQVIQDFIADIGIYYNNNNLTLQKIKNNYFLTSLVNKYCNNFKNNILVSKFRSQILNLTLVYIYGCLTVLKIPIKVEEDLYYDTNNYVDMLYNIISKFSNRCYFCGYWSIIKLLNLLIKETNIIELSNDSDLYCIIVDNKYIDYKIKNIVIILYNNNIIRELFEKIIRQLHPGFMKTIYTLFMACNNYEIL